MNNVLLIGLTVLCIMLVGCLPKNYELDSKSFTSDYLKLVEQKVGITLPVGAHGLNMYNAQAQIDPSFLAKIEIPKDSTDSMIKQLRELPTQSLSIKDYVIDRVNWWHPETASIKIEKRFSRPAYRDCVDIFLCDENGRMILYVDWMIG